MFRRRLTAVAAVAAVAAAAIAGSVALHQLRQGQSLIARGPYHVTVRPPGAGSAPGLIAEGTIGGRHWSATAHRSGRSTICFRAFGLSCEANGAPRASGHGDPAQFGLRTGTRPQIDIGTVRTDVSYLRVSLTNGQVLTLRPVAVFGKAHPRYVALAVPEAADVTVVTAYSARGELAFADPFTALGSVQTVRWLAPGALASDVAATYRIASGVQSGANWSENIYVGPWGTCVGGTGEFAAASTCVPVSPRSWLGGNFGQQLIQSFGAGGNSLIVFAVAPQVSHLAVTRADGTIERVRPVLAGGVRFCTFAVSASNKATRWQALGVSGTVLASGRIP